MSAADRRVTLNSVSNNNANYPTARITGCKQRNCGKPKANASRRGYMLKKHNVAGLNICTANIQLINVQLHRDERNKTPTCRVSLVVRRSSGSINGSSSVSSVNESLQSLFIFNELHFWALGCCISTHQLAEQKETHSPCKRWFCTLAGSFLHLRHKQELTVRNSLTSLMRSTSWKGGNRRNKLFALPDQ